MACLVWSLVYSAAHLASICEERLGGGTGENYTKRGSVLQPPGIDAEELKVYHTMYSAMFVIVLLTWLSLLVGVCKDLPCLLLPWIGSTLICTVGEASVYVYIIFHSKTRLDPVSCFVLVLEFFVLMVQVYTMVCIYYQYKEYKEGAIRPNAAPDLVLFEPSSEVATARFSSVRRKSLTDSLFRKSRTMSPLVSSKRASLSRICEEESGNQCLSSDREEEEEGGKGGTTNTSMASHPCREMSEEEKEEGSKEEKEEKEEEKRRKSGSAPAVNEEEKEEKRFGDKSRFLPEVIDPNRVTIV